MGLFDRSEGQGNILDPAAITTGGNTQQHFDPGGFFGGQSVVGGPNYLNNFRASQAPLDESNYTDALLKAQQLQAYYSNQQNQTTGQNQELIRSLQAQSQGQGPNLANAQLQQATNQNIRQQASLLGSQRGMNSGNTNRLITEQGGNIGQQAAAQSSVNRLQQQLAAQGQLANAINSQFGANQGMAGLGGQLAQTYGNLQNSQNANRIQNIAQAQGLNEKALQSNAESNKGLLGGLIGGGSSALAAGLGAKGGEVTEDGFAGPSNYAKEDYDYATADQEKKKGGGVSELLPLLALLSKGGKIDGQGLVKGDSVKNDIVPARLSPGEIVIPRSISQSPDAAKKAAAFVAAIEKTHKPNEKVEYRHILEHRKACGGRV